MTLRYRSIAVGLTIGVIAGGAGGALAQSSSATHGSGNQHQGTSNSEMRRQWSAWAGPGDASGWQASWSGNWNVPGAIATAAANYLGISPASLTGELQSLTLAQIARARGKSVAALQNAIASAVKKELDVTRALTGTEKSALAAAVAGHIGLALTAHCPNGLNAGGSF